MARAATLAVFMACHEDDRAAASKVASQPPPALPGPMGSATISGSVRFIGTAPANPTIDMRREPLCRNVYHSPPHQLTVVLNRNGTLANVFVYLKRGLPAGAVYPQPAEPVTLDQRGCQYQPRVFGIMVGQPLEVRNIDPLVHNISAARKANRPRAIDQPAAGFTADHTFRAAQVMVPLTCTVHAWMRAYAGVLPHPFFAVTGRDGRFTIDRVPRGTYTIEAWHEKYGRRTATVTVADSAIKELSFTYTTPVAAETS